MVLLLLKEIIRARMPRYEGVIRDRPSSGHQHTVASHPATVLRRRHLWPRGSAAEQRDELAPSYHSITSSAMASNPGGKLRPNTLAVLRLITNSNLLDCMTGRSAGFSLFKIRPAYTPAWRCA